MDTTYFGRKFGALVLFDAISKTTLSVDIVPYETNQTYYQAVCQLRRKGIDIQSIICDGRKGLDKLFPDIPIQRCQFHQIQTITRLLTKRPKSLPAQELRALALSLPETTERAFKQELDEWHHRHQDYPNERSFSEDGKRSWRTHQRLFKAYNSLKKNTSALFTFERFKELEIPNTTNSLESRFAGLKTHLRCHQGLKMERKILLIKKYFSIQA